MDQLGVFLQRVSKRMYQEDSVDRLNYHYTVWLLIAFAMTLSVKQYVGDPIQCWVPAEFSGGWEQYTENYCFIENTYFVPFSEDIPIDDPDRRNREIAYYQWVPFILALQALLFSLPHIIWRQLNLQSNLRVRGLITDACNIKDTSEDSEKNIQYIAWHMYTAIDMERRPRDGGNVRCNRLCKGYYLTIVYLIVKILFIANLIGQFFMLNSFLGTTYNFWGMSILTDIIRGHDWQISGHFPRVTVCDFEVRALGQTRRYTVQCVLMINMFTEKIFLFIWWWFTVVVCATIVNFFYWIVVSFSGDSRRRYVEQLVGAFPSKKNNPQYATTREMESAAFSRFLGPDGVLVLRLMANNAGEMTTSRVCQAVYNVRLEEEVSRRPQRPPPPSVKLSQSDNYQTTLALRPATFEKTP